MRKIVICVVITVITCTVAVSQPRAIGGRVAYGIGPSYQHGFGEKNMLQADLDVVGFFGIQLTATYNWIIPIKSWTGAGSWNLYAGVGAGGGYSWGWRTGGLNYYGYNSGYWGSNGFVGVALMFGAEYNFKFPLQVFADWRPLICPRFYRGGHVDYFTQGLYASAFSVGARYRFGNK